MRIFDTCPACNAPVYDDPLDALFDPKPNWRVYECGARLEYHDAPPVHVEIVTRCPYAMRKWIEKAQAQPPSDYPSGAYWKLIEPERTTQP